MARRILGFVLTLVAVVLVAAACGGGTAEVAENILEQQPGVENVEIDPDDESMSVSYESQEGGIVMEMGSGTALPDGFPLPIHGDCVVVGSSTWKGPDSESMQAGLEFPLEDFDAVVAYYEDFLEVEGFEITKTTSGSGSDEMVMLLANRADTTASVVVSQTDLNGSAGLNWSTDTS